MIVFQLHWVFSLGVFFVHALKGMGWIINPHDPRVVWGFAPPLFFLIPKSLLEQFPKNVSLPQKTVSGMTDWGVFVAAMIPFSGILRAKHDQNSLAIHWGLPDLTPSIIFQWLTVKPLGCTNSKIDFQTWSICWKTSDFTPYETYRNGFLKYHHPNGSAFFRKPMLSSYPHKIHVWSIYMHLP